MIGIAGGVGPSVRIGDVVVPEVVLDAAGGEHRPVPLPGTTPRGIMRTSGEIDVTDDDVAALRDRGVIALDMETAAVGAVCEARGVPWSVVRAISDHTDDGFVDSAVLSMTNSDGTPNVGAVVRYLARHPFHIARLSKLARGARMATTASAAAAYDGIAALARQ
jgi:adenosylhomocysteine nucleosidase